MPVMHTPEHSDNESDKGPDDTRITNPFLGFEDEEAPMDPAVKKELEALFRQRRAVRQKLVRIRETLLSQQQSGQLLSLAQFNVMDRNLTSIYQEFNTFHNMVMALIPDGAVIQQDAIYADFERSHNEAAATVQEFLLVVKNAAAPPAAPQIIVKQQPLKAPIPTFDGTYSMWPKFKAIFEDLMASAGDTDALKLYHLDKALIGDAAGVLDAKVMAEGDYKRAWAILTERFENKRVIVECHIRGLLSLKKMTSESYKELRALLDEVVRHVEGLRYQQQQLLGVSEHIIVYLIAAALDKPTRKAWEATQKKGELPNYEPTIKFLKSRCQVLENCEMASIGQAQPAKPKSVSQPTARAQSQKSYAATTSTGSSATSETCDVCSGSHRSFQCPVLDKLTVAQRNEKVKVAGICFNCLRKGHRSSDCQSKQSCKKCQRRHHTMLHEEKTPASSVTVPAGAEGTSIPAIQTTANPGSVVQQAAVESPSVSSTCNCARADKTVLLLTAVVHALDRNDQPHRCRVLLDSGSQKNFVSEKMVNVLGLKKQPTNVPITGINALRTHAREKVLLKFRSRVSSFHANVECLVTRRVTGTIPTSKIDVCQWGLPDGLQLADPEFHKPGEVDMLIGAELFFDFFKTGQLSLADNLPQLRDTHLGWIVTGVVDEPFIASPALHCYTTTIADVENMMQRFWQIEEVPDVPKLSDEELACEAHFLSTYKRDATGRFVVRLPLKDDISKLNDCRDLALKRFLMQEERLQRNPDLKQQYVEFVREYEALGHCHEVKEADDPPDQVNYHMPHHAVLRPSSSSTKCRIVFDASAKKSADKSSLNELLRIGAVVQAFLFSIVLRFRKYKVAFTTDIVKMYRQIRMSPEDTHYQRIFWREQPSQPIRVLELDTVTYGTASAPYQATRCLVQLAEEEADHFPVAARILKQEVYMDDVLSGADTLEEALEAQEQLKTLLGHGGFPVHKWCSNSREFLANVPPEDREKQVPIEENAANEVIKVLGLLWDSTADTFMMAHQASSEPPAKSVTKRKIYAEVARFYDPLGLFSPTIVLAKLLAQQLWKLKSGWDDPVDDAVSQQWQELTRSLPHLKLIQVPRCVTFNDAVAYELHGFSDASNVAYGACIYLRSLFTDGSARMRLLTSKSKLAPLHDLTIPRKELCAALLLVRLLVKVIEALEMKLQEIVLWCDSTIVLAWIKKPLNQLQVFVRNRTSEIQKHTGTYRWQYIRSQHNPADVVSRGQLPEALKENSLWWSGPDFLSQCTYEIDEPEDVPDEMLPEMKPVVVTTAVNMEPFPVFYRFSSFRKVQRIIGYVMRFVANCRKKNSTERQRGTTLTVGELRRSSEAIIHVIQLVHLADEIHRVINNEPCKKLGNLAPFYQDGLLRVGGRLKHSNLPFWSRHPIVLPHKDPLVRNLVREMHIELLHLGQTGLINAMRQRYWLMNARSTIRMITRQCVRCFRTNPTNNTQLMGNLPSSRVVPSPPFAVTGVDYAGPFWLKQGARRHPVYVKGYVAVFVCMTTKAVHLEAVSDLSTDAFLAALRRLIGRRGNIHELHSDNATNFRGAQHELHQLYLQHQDKKEIQRIEEACKRREIEWHFIPANAPEFGGLWEAAVKSAKTHLKRIVGNTKLTFEELTTVLIDIEAVLNSRPLFSVSNDPNDPIVITPAHYFIGRPLTSPPEPSLEDVKVGRLDRWQHLKLMREQFWRVWSNAYLNTLQPRKKNLRTMPNVRVGMIGLLQDRNREPLDWKLGRITAVYPGDDNLVRAVDITIGETTYRRPINKVSILPIEDNRSLPVPVETVSQPGGGCSV